MTTVGAQFLSAISAALPDGEEVHLSGDTLFWTRAGKTDAHAVWAAGPMLQNALAKVLERLCEPALYAGTERGQENRDLAVLDELHRVELVAHEGDTPDRVETALRRRVEVARARIGWESSLRAAHMAQVLSQTGSKREAARALGLQIKDQGDNQAIHKTLKDAAARRTKLRKAAKLARGEDPADDNGQEEKPQVTPVITEKQDGTWAVNDGPSGRLIGHVAQADDGYTATTTRGVRIYAGGDKDTAVASLVAHRTYLDGLLHTRRMQRKESQ